MKNYKLKSKSQINSITINEIKTFLKIDGNEEDPLILELIKTAESLAEKYTSRSLLTQTWELIVSHCDESIRRRFIKLNKPPIQKILNFKIYNSFSERIINSNEYFLDNDELIFHNAEIALNQNLKIEFQSGYGDLPSSIPEPIKHCLKLCVAQFYENRRGEEVLSEGCKVILNQYRDWSNIFLG